MLGPSVNRLEASKRKSQAAEGGDNPTAIFFVLFSSVETSQHDYISPHATVSVSQIAILMTANWSKVGQLLLEGADKAEAGEEDRVVRQFSFSDSHPNQAY